MGLLDKVKVQAAQATATATAAAKEAAQKGQAKLDAIQAKRAADAILRDLGVAVYAQRTGRGTDATEADVEHLVGALQEHEVAHGAVDLAYESPAAAPSAQAGPGPTGDQEPPPDTGESV